MARMHTRRKGQAGSTRPLRSAPPEWSNIGKDEVEKVVVELAKQGKSSSVIGMTLRDRYGVPDITLATSKKVGTIRKEKNVAPKIPEDIYNLISNVLSLQKHLDANPNDVHNKRAYQNMISKIRRLEKYYHREGVLLEDWQFSIKNAELLIA